MLEDPQVQELTRQITAEVMPSSGLVEIMSEPMIDFDGREVLRITLVLTDEAAKTFSGDQALTLLNELRDSLLREGDERFPLIYYMTESDRAEGDLEDDEG